MIRLERLRPAAGPLAAGLLFAFVSHPVVSGLLLWALGEPARRPLGYARLAELAWHHLVLALTGLAIVGLLGISLGILVTRPGSTRLRGGVDSAAALVQAVPPIVVVALALPVLGFGGPPTLLALVAYAVMPTLRATVGAIEAVPRDVREAARAIGFTPGQVLRRIELPLAGAGILDSLRVALVLSIATVAVGALAGATTLGTPIIAGLQNQNLLPLLQGTSAAAALAYLCDAAMLAVAGLLRR